MDIGMESGGGAKFNLNLHLDNIMYNMRKAGLRWRKRKRRSSRLSKYPTRSRSRTRLQGRILFRAYPVSRVRGGARVGGAMTHECKIEEGRCRPCSERFDEFMSRHAHHEESHEHPPYFHRLRALLRRVWLHVSGQS